MAPKVDARKRINQIRRKKGNSTPSVSASKVGDLRQIIVKKTKAKAKTRSSGGAGGRSTSSTRNGAQVRDLRDTNKKLALGRRSLPARDTGRGNQKRPAVNSIRAPASGLANKVLFQGRAQQQYYVPPHLQAQQPTYIIAPTPNVPSSNLAMDNEPETREASILISNLLPSITQTDIIELFGSVGTMTAVNTINQTTSLVTYQKSSDAVEAVKLYHNRLLDGKPMMVNMMPSPASTSNVRSRIGQPAGRSSAAGFSFTARR